MVLKRANTPLEFKPAALRAIIVGCRGTGDVFAKLKLLLTERTAANMPPITIYQCSQDASRYEIGIYKAPDF